MRKPKIAADTRCLCCRPTSYLHVDAPEGPARRAIERARQVAVYVHLGDGEGTIFNVPTAMALDRLKWAWEANPAFRVHLMIVPNGRVCIGSV